MPADNITELFALKKRGKVHNLRTCLNSNFIMRLASKRLGQTSRAIVFRMNVLPDASFLLLRSFCNFDFVLKMILAR